MPHVKTAISIQEPMYQAATKTAKKLRISRSQLFEQAITEYLVKIDNTHLLNSLNKAYQAPADRIEQDYLASMKRLTAKNKTKQW